MSAAKSGATIAAIESGFGNVSRRRITLRAARPHPGYDGFRVRWLLLENEAAAFVLPVHAGKKGHAEQILR